MRQLALGFTPPALPSFDNFVAGANGELVETLRELTQGHPGEAVVYLWGEEGSGRSHLLAATVRSSAPGRSPVIADDVQRLDEVQQLELFNRIHEARESGGRVIAAGDAPPAQLALREDLKSRLGWGLVYQVKPLTDAEKALFMRGEAERRGLRLADEVLWYLLNHVRRDMPSLCAILEHLDQFSLERQRHITLPLVREALRTLDA